jgi:gamma-glutamyltranspeptidase / glutathione hydrolase
MNHGRLNQSSNGVVAAGDHQSAQAGARVLRAGGNAADAAVAAGFAACVCEIALCGPLGGGVAVSQFGSAPAQSWDFFARVPGLGHTLDERLEFGQAVIDFGVTQQTFQVGRGAASLGLALPGLLELHSRHGTLPLSEVVAPAVQLGREGYVVGEQMAYILSLIEPIFKWTKPSHALCFPDGHAPPVGTRLRNTALADVFENIGKSAKDVQALYLQFAREFGPEQGGLITQQDIQDLSVRTLKPIDFDWNGWSVSSMPAPSSGGVLIGIGARILKGMNLRQPFGSIGHYTEIAAAQRMLLEIRTDDFDERIESEDYVQALLHKMTLDELAGLAGVEWPDSVLGSTTQISAMDSAGDVVSMTLTNGEGCGCVLEGCGIQVNNLLGEEDINPKGFHQAEAGSYMQTMMAPTIGRLGSRRIALGSGGSNRLRNAILSTLLNVIEYNMPLDQAVHQPRLHVDRCAQGTGINFEAEGVPAGLPALLQTGFDDVTEFPSFNMFFGGVHAVELSDGVFSGVGDRRRGGRFVIA